MVRHLLCTSIALVVTTFLCAQQNFLNPQFSSEGKTLVNFYDKTNDNYSAVAIDVTKEEKVLLAGDVNYEAVVHRIDPSGNDDISYGTKGFRFFDFGLSGNNRIEEILKYPAEKTILIGHASPCISEVNKY